MSIINDSNCGFQKNFWNPQNFGVDSGNSGDSEIDNPEFPGTWGITEDDGELGFSDSGFGIRVYDSIELGLAIQNSGL